MNNQFDRPQTVEELCVQLRYAEWKRGRNRALINSLFNGAPPYTAQDEKANNINCNVNFLEGTRLSHDARSQFYQAMLKPGTYFTSSTDWGPVHKRQEAGMIVTQERNRVMKRNMVYTESQRSGIAQNVLHGIAPSGWRDDQKWCPYAMDIADVYLTDDTLLTMENLPLFVIYRTFTGMELIKLTQAGKLDPAWNKPMLKEALKWIDKETQQLSYQQQNDIWRPEAAEERIKGDGGLYYGDRAPTINVFDFYFWNDSNKESGWNRRMVLDSWSMPDMSTVGSTNSVPTPQRRTGDLFNNADYRRQFLYDPGTRKVALNRSEIINWQFADLSAVAPFRYHTVRSLGFLLYNVCHLQNRLRCKFNEAVFEQLMIYFRVKNQGDAQRALQVDLVNKGFIDESIDFIKPEDRYRVNEALAQMGLNQNQMLIAANAASFTTMPQTQDNKERTKFEVMTNVDSMNSLISASISQALMYKLPEFREIARRFAIKNSKDVEVRQFQANCLRRGVSEKLLYNPEAWDHSSDRSMGAGNKTVEMAKIQQLMEWKPQYSPAAQDMILKSATFVVTDDPAFAEALVPNNPVKITDSVHDAQLAAGTLMMGLPVAVKEGINHIEYVDAMLATLGSLVGQFVQGQTIPTEQELKGMMNMAQHIGQHIAIIAQDKNEQQRVRQYGDALGQIGNQLKAFGQQLAEKKQAEAAQGPQQDPETMAKIQAIQLQAQVKAQNSTNANAQRTAQKQLQFELDQQRKRQAFELEMRQEEMAMQQAMKLEDVETANSIVLERAAAKSKASAEKKVDKAG